MLTKSRNLTVIFLVVVAGSYVFALDMLNSRPISEQATVTPFEVWDKFSEAKVLNLFPGFIEPTVSIVTAGVEQKKKLKMSVITIRSKAKIEKSVKQIQFDRLLDPNLFQKLDPEAKQVSIIERDAMPISVARGSVMNFKWCNTNPNPKKVEILLPTLERSQSHMARPNVNWCSGDSHLTKCFEVCRLVPSGTGMYSAIAAYNFGKDLKGEVRSKDYGMAMQFEARLFKDEKELPIGVSLSSLTQVPTEVAGVVEVSFYYFNQMVQFGKILLVIQPDPAKPFHTVVTGLNAFAMRTDVWNHPIGGSMVQNLIEGRSNFNATSGILAGVPKFSQNAVNIFAEAINAM